MKRPTAQHGGARMKCNGDSLSLPLSLPYSCIYVLDSQPTVAWPPTTVAWPFSDFFQKNFNLLETSKKTLFDSRSTVAWPPTTVAWPFSDFFQKTFKLLETSKKRCLTVGRRSRDLRPLSRDRSVTFFKKISNCLKRPKNVVWQSADGRVTSDHCRVTIQWLFSKIFLNAWNVQKRCLIVIQRSRDLRPLSRDLQWLFSKFFRIAWNVKKTLFDSHTTVAWPPTTDAWPSVIFFKNFSELLETYKKRCLTVIQQSPDLRLLSRDLQWLFSKFFRIAWNV